MSSRGPERLLARRVLVAAPASGRVLRLEEPLSLWGGLDPRTGEIIDRRHPQSGEVGSGRVWCMVHGRGSSSASSILLEAVRLRTAPAAILLLEEDGILSLGATVAQELYGHSPAILLLAPRHHRQLEDGELVEIAENGAMRRTTT